MLGSLIKGFTETVGNVVGEITHQTGKVYDATIEELIEVKDAIVDMPDTLSKGYEDELFEAKERDDKTPQPSRPAVGNSDDNDLFTKPTAA